MLWHIDSPSSNNNSQFEATGRSITHRNLKVAITYNVVNCVIFLTIARSMKFVSLAVRGAVGVQCCVVCVTRFQF